MPTEGELESLLFLWITCIFIFTLIISVIPKRQFFEASFHNLCCFYIPLPVLFDLIFFN